MISLGDARTKTIFIYVYKIHNPLWYVNSWKLLHKKFLMISLGYLFKYVDLEASFYIFIYDSNPVKHSTLFQRSSDAHSIQFTSKQRVVILGNIH